LDSILSPIAAIFLKRLREARALGQEAVAGVDGLGAGRLAGGDDRVGEQIAFGRGRGAEPHRLVRHVDMRVSRVGVRIDGDRLDAHLLRGLDNAAGDFAAVGDQDFFEHDGSPKPSP
jgi:hypothetical protein